MCGDRVFKLRHVVWLLTIALLVSMLLAGCSQAEIDEPTTPTPGAGTGTETVGSGTRRTGIVELVWTGNGYEERVIEDFEAFIKQTDKPIFVDFWAIWCPPCLEANPFVHSLPEVFDGKAHILKADIDVRYANAVHKGQKLSAVPAFVLFKGGVAVDHVVGYSKNSDDLLTQMIERNLVGAAPTDPNKPPGIELPIHGGKPFIDPDHTGIVELLWIGSTHEEKMIDDYNEFLMEADKPVIVVFVSDTSPFYIEADPFIKSLPQVFAQRAHVVEIDIYQPHGALVYKSYDLDIIPTFFVIREGEIVYTTNGYGKGTEDYVIDMLGKHLK